MSSRVEIDQENIGLPSEDLMSSRDGLVENHLYIDVRGWDLEGYERLLEDEIEILDWAAAGGDLQSDEAFERFLDWEAWCTGIDPGLICTVIALSVVGCCPITSCVGGEGHAEDHPLVAFWCTQQTWPLIESAAIATGCSVKGFDSPGIIVHHGDDWRPLRAFGAELIKLWKKPDNQ